MAANQNSKPERIDRGIGCIKPIINLMQNCDLPPPVKLFSSPDENLHSSMNKLEILRALRLSQTRAREAERKLRVVSKEKEMLTNVLVDESLRLFAHRQLVRLLELQVFKMQREQRVEMEDRESYYGVSNCAEKPKARAEGTKSRSWCAAIAFCFAIAGVGFAIGCRYFV